MVCVRYATRDGVWKVQCIYIRRVFHEYGAAGSLAKGPLHLIVVFVANQNDGVSVASKFDSFQVNFRNQRARCVDHLQATRFRFPPDFRRNPVRAENSPRAGWNFIDFLHEDRASLTKFLHNMFVVNDFLPDVDRRAIKIESDLDYINCPDDACTKPTRL